MFFQLLIFFCILGFSNALLNHSCTSSETSDLWIDDNDVNHYPSNSPDFSQQTWDNNGECIGVVPNTYPHTCTVGYSLVNEEGSAPCFACNYGEYQDNPNYRGSECKLCPVGYYAGRTPAPKCLACPAGWSSKYEYFNGYGTRFRKCSQCVAGRFSNEASACQNCPDGYLSTGAGSTNNDCTIKCPNMTTTNSETPIDSSNPNTECVACPVGFWSGGDGGPCYTCSAGYGILSDVSTVCEGCPIGKYSWDTVCTDCPIGYAGLNTKGNWRCQKCPPGKSTNETGLAYWGDSCKDCPVGKFTGANTGTNNPIHYEDGKSYITGPGGSQSLYTGPPFLASHVCRICPFDTFSTSEGSQQCTSCNDFDIFSSTFEMGGSNTLIVIDNPVASWSADEEKYLHKPTVNGIGITLLKNGTTQCRRCPPGQELKRHWTYPTGAATKLGEFRCNECPVGWHSPTGQCLQCPSGWVQNKTGQTTCNECSAGTFSIPLPFSERMLLSDSSIDLQNETYGQKLFRVGDIVDSQNIWQTQWEPLGGVNCIQCPVGTYSDQSGIGLTRRVTTFSTWDMTTEEPLTFGPDVDFRWFACKTCPIGKYNDKIGSTSETSCETCPKGRYGDKLKISNMASDDECLLCDAGYFSEAEDSLRTCRECPAGYYSGEESGNCTGCAAGKSSVEGSAITGCDSCQPGTKEQNHLCVNCAKGKYSNYTNPVACKDCTIGQYQGQEGQTNCKHCPDGFTNDDVTIGDSVIQDWTRTSTPTFSEITVNCEIRCPVGQYSESGSGCLECPVGKYTDNTGSSSCTNCPIGTYNNQTGQKKCKTCPDGTINPNTGADDISDCTACDTGKTTSWPFTECSSCPKGRYSENGSPFCQACPVGFAGNVLGATSLDSCIACAKGKYNHMEGNSECYTCPSGYVSPSNGSSACAHCELNEYQESSGQSECVLCPGGKFSTDIAQTACQDCPAGQYSESGSDCLECPVGKAQDESGKSSCKNCETDKMSKRGSTECHDFRDVTNDAHSGQCQFDSWTLLALQQKSMSDTCGQNKTFVENLIKCPGGEYFDNECKKCPPGSFSSAQDDGCRFCPLARSSPEGSDSEDDCVPCDNGFATLARETDRGMPSKLCGCGGGKYLDSNECKECSAGYGSNTDAVGSSDCQACPKGKYSKQGQPCIICQSGFYQDVVGQTECKSCGARSSKQDRSACTDCVSGTFVGDGLCEECPQGRYQNALNQQHCITCEFGKYAAATKSETCSSCPDGKYSQKTGQASIDSCKECPSGKYASSNQQSCITCSVGTFKLNTTTTQCEQCPTGHTSSVDFQSCVSCGIGTYYNEVTFTCDNCPVGYYTDSVEQTSCKPCDAGTYNNIEGSDSCQSCDLLEGEWSDAGAEECSTCGVGIRPVGFPYCFRCDAGKVLFDNTSGTSIDDFCTDCPAGKTTNGYTDTCIDFTVGQLEFNESKIYIVGSDILIQTEGELGYCPVGYYKQGDACVQCSGAQTAGAGHVYIPEDCPGSVPNWKDAYDNTCEWYESEGYCKYGMPTYKDIDVSHLNVSSLDLNEYGTRRNKILVDNVLACGPDNIGCDNKGAYESCDVCNAVMKCQPQKETTPKAFKTLFNVFNDACMDCPPGTTSVENNCLPCYNDDNCNECLAGTFFKDNIGCIACPKGYFQPDQNQKSCKVCPVGTGLDTNTVLESDCGECPSGFFADNGHVNFLEKNKIDIQQDILLNDTTFQESIGGFLPNSTYIIEQWSFNKDMGQLFVGEQSLESCQSQDCNQQVCYHNQATYLNPYTVTTTSEGTLSVSGTFVTNGCTQPSILHLEFKFSSAQNNNIFFVPNSYAESENIQFFGCHKCPSGTNSLQGDVRCT